MNTPAIDKSAWGPGPWHREPDHLEFRAHGFPCILHRQPELGHWCGYVGVPPGHPWHGQNVFGTYGADDKYVPSRVDADVHGGLTYAAACQGPICHVPAEGESDDVWWLGFDCAHAGDLSPGMSRHLRFPRGDSYWLMEQVQVETERLAEQAKAVFP